MGYFVRFARARAHLRTLMTQKSCTVEMRNAILRNHLEVIPEFCIVHSYCARFLRYQRAHKRTRKGIRDSPQTKLDSEIKALFLLNKHGVKRITWALLFCNKKYRSPCSFKRKRAFISLSSLACGIFLTFCTCTRSFARANDAKIVRSTDAQCNTEESP